MGVIPHIIFYHVYVKFQMLCGINYAGMKIKTRKILGLHIVKNCCNIFVVVVVVVYAVNYGYRGKKVHN